MIKFKCDCGFKIGYVQDIYYIDDYLSFTVRCRYCGKKQEITGKLLLKDCQMEDSKAIVITEYPET